MLRSRQVLNWLAVAAVIGCRGDAARVERDVVRVALVQLFTVREHAQAITLWRDPTVSLTLDALPDADARPRVTVDSATLALPLRIESANRASMDAFFHEHASGWDAWFEAHPANAGLVEVAQPQMRGDTATVVVGRACGEQCRNAWRVTLVRASGAWTVQQVDVLSVPRGT